MMIHCIQPVSFAQNWIVYILCMFLGQAKASLCAKAVLMQAHQCQAFHWTLYAGHEDLHSCEHITTAFASAYEPR